MPDLCSAAEVNKVLKLVGMIILIAKICVPLILVVLGSIDLGKAVVSNKNDAIQTNVKTLALRLVCGVIIFFIPNIILFVMSLVNADNNQCIKCVLDISTCQ